VAKFKVANVRKVDVIPSVSVKINAVTPANPLGHVSNIKVVRFGSESLSEPVGGVVEHKYDTPPGTETLVRVNTPL